MSFCGLGENITTAPRAPETRAGLSIGADAYAGSEHLGFSPHATTSSWATQANGFSVFICTGLGVLSVDERIKLGAAGNDLADCLVWNKCSIRKAFIIIIIHINFRDSKNFKRNPQYFLRKSESDFFGIQKSQWPSEELSISSSSSSLCRLS